MSCLQNIADTINTAIPVHKAGTLICIFNTRA
jgi:hypothetical protein